MAPNIKFPDFEVPKKLYLTTSETSRFCGVPNYTLSKWEKVLPMLKPTWRQGRRYYRKCDVEMVFKIKHLIYEEGMSCPAAELYLLSGTKSYARVRDQIAAKESRKGFARLNMDLGFTMKYIEKVCRVSDRTASRYLRTGMAPYATARLLELERSGRILPETWKHCFINPKGNLEIYSVGEVHENDIVNLRWYQQLQTSRIRNLELQLEQARAQVKELEQQLSENGPALLNGLVANDDGRLTL